MFVTIVKVILAIPLLRRYRTTIGNFLLKFVFIRNIFEKSIQQESGGFNHKYEIEYSNPTTFYQLPEHGCSFQACLELIQEYANYVNGKISNKHFSGTIYQKFEQQNLVLPETLQSLYLQIFNVAHIWNSLHADEFGIANLLNLQVVACVADLFGGNLKDVHGLVTSGGTQSIMTAARMYINYGMSEKHLPRERCTIIAPDTIHCSLNKAAQAYGFKLVLVPTNSRGHVDKHILKEQLKYHAENLVAIYCSYPSYPYGTKDDLQFFVGIAEKYCVGLHVDCCLGGFVVNFVDEIGKKILQFPRVTSLSVDTHKNGLCPKGSSVLITKKLGQRNLFYHSIYVVPDWKGGLYGTPSDEGSTSCVQAFCTLITLVFYGKNYYENLAKKIQETANEMVLKLRKHDIVQIINSDVTNVVALRISGKKGITYHLGDLMAEKGFVFNAMTDDIIHFCITKRFVDAPESLENFLRAFAECLDIIQKPTDEYDGNARMYCSADTVKQLGDETSVSKYLENYFFGLQGIGAVIKENFMASNNPFVD